MNDPEKDFTRNLKISFEDFISICLQMEGRTLQNELIKSSKRWQKGYNQLYLNAFFDILNGIYIDCVLEPDRKCHERAAFNVMVDRCKLNVSAIVMADRGYEGMQPVCLPDRRSCQKIDVLAKKPILL